MSISDGITSNTRCAKTVPSSVGVAPSAPGIFRVSTPTRANSPIRPGSTAFASSPMPKAENVRENLGVSFGSASRMTVCQANARVTAESRLKMTAATTQRSSTTRNASATAPHSGPRQ